MKDRRIGLFSVSGQLIENNPEMVRAIMGKVIVVRCELLWSPYEIEYVAISPDFDEISEGVVTPRYEVVVGDDIVFKRIT